MVGAYNRFTEKLKVSKTIKAFQKWGILIIASVFTTGTLYGDRVIKDFNKDWKFQKGSQSLKVREMDFDDSSWQEVRLPHDWAIADPFNPNEYGYSGKLPWKGNTYHFPSCDGNKSSIKSSGGVSKT